MTPSSQRRYRDGDTRGTKLLAAILRQRVLAGAVWTLVGGTVTALVMRLFLVTQLNAQALRLTHLEGEQVTMKNGIVGLTKSACLDRTPAEQTLADLTCPFTLYKGVLQGVPRGSPAP